MKVCLLGASFDTNNMGVSALAAGSIESLLHSCPDAEVSLLDYGKKGRTLTYVHNGKPVAVKLVNIRFSKKFWLANNIARLIVEAVISRLIPTEGLRRSFIARNPWLRHVDEVDVVASIAGGDSFSDIYGLSRFIYVALPQALALLMRRPLVLLPQTLGPFNGRVARHGAKYIMHRARAVYSRDHAGLAVGREFLHSGDASDKLRFCYDVAFVVEPRKPASLACEWSQHGRREDSPVVGVNVSGLLFSKGHQWTNAFGLRVDYKSFILTLVEHLIQEKGASVLLTPHVFGSDGECDSPACEVVYNAFRDKYPGKIGIVQGRYKHSEIKYIIGQCDLFVGSRMHSCIAAVSQCVPAVSIAYSGKFIGVMQSIGMDSLVADPRNASAEEILNIVDTAFERRALLRKQLEKTIPEVRQKVLCLFSEFSGVESVVSAGNLISRLAAAK